MIQHVYLPCGSCGESQLVALDDGVPEGYMGQFPLVAFKPSAIVVGGNCVHSPKAGATEHTESKMRDRFGAPLHIGDRVLHLSAVSSTPHVKTGTIRSWGQWGGKISVKIALDNGRELEARSENLLIRWRE